MNISFWKWWTVFNIGLFSIGIGYVFFGLGDFLSRTDSTNISTVILLIAIFSSFAMWIQHKKISAPSAQNDVYWFTSDAVTTLGMIGTLIGFLIVLGQAFVDIDPGNITSMKDAIEILAIGMSTALVTTLVGITSSLWLKFQLVLLEGR